MITNNPKFDVIGDIHGYLDNLESLGRWLGYDAEWRHPEGRFLVFIGDLIDRGPHSLEVAELVMRLVSEQRAICLLGNHEYNLLEHVDAAHGKIRTSNRATIEDLDKRADRWEPVLAFLRTLPVAFETEALQIVHAAWEPKCIETLQLPSDIDSGSEMHIWLNDCVRIASPATTQADIEDLIKGPELVSEPFVDLDGKQRTHQRVKWWQHSEYFSEHAKTIVFGHYWNIPPVDKDLQFVPHYLPTEPLAADSYAAIQDAIGSHGRVPVPDDQLCVCIDYMGVAKQGMYSCIGAFRWPEHEVCWSKLRLSNS